MLLVTSIPAVRTLLEDHGEGFYAVAIGAPPGIHRTRESATRAEGSFTHPIWRHAESFWEALAFMVVKGVNECMPPLLTSAEILDAVDESVDALGDVLNNTLHIEPHSAPSGPPVTVSLGSVSARSELSTASTSSDLTPASSRHATVPSPIIYTHVRNLRGVIESRHYYTPSSGNEAHARPLGLHAARYLGAHGFTVPDIDIIIYIRRRATSGQHFTMRLAREVGDVASH
ncbi:hypothetical protein HYDPIDRAFT_31272 [Hydnomerulius pinastri MD-312]|uniref:Uncharacterized protein n=1 Tax=Hydnomerulius pinastri MD-312 TaxID=994086 RepID=A0A0C9WBQ2_9AGAM|nr:hypothetical protein HYDPIDRAFT_31272 [Hydnomerulius pinastri MD-312]